MIALEALESARADLDEKRADLDAAGEALDAAGSAAASASSAAEAAAEIYGDACAAGDGPAEDLAGDTESTEALHRLAILRLRGAERRAQNAASAVHAAEQSVARASLDHYRPVADRAALFAACDDVIKRLSTALPPHPELDPTLTGSALADAITADAERREVNALAMAEIRSNRRAQSEAVEQCRSAALTLGQPMPPVAPVQESHLLAAAALAAHLAANGTPDRQWAGAWLTGTFGVDGNTIGATLAHTKLAGGDFRWLRRALELGDPVAAMHQHARAIETPEATAERSRHERQGSEQRGAFSAHLDTGQ